MITLAPNPTQTLTGTWRQVPSSLLHTPQPNCGLVTRQHPWLVSPTLMPAPARKMEGSVTPTMVGQPTSSRSLFTISLKGRWSREE